MVLTLSRAVPIALVIVFATFMSGFGEAWTLSLSVACIVVTLLTFQLINKRKHKGQRVKLEIDAIGMTNAAYPSWVFVIAGYRLHKVTLKNDIEVLLLSRQSVFNLSKHTIDAVEINSCCFMDVAK